MRRVSKGPSLHHLRAKVSAAAAVKHFGVCVSRVPGGKNVLDTVASWLNPWGSDPTGSYGGILAELLRQPLDNQSGSAGAYDDSVAGLLPGGTQVAPPVKAKLSSPLTPSEHIALASAYRKPYIAEYEKALWHYKKAFEANPRDLRAIGGILSTGVRSTSDWPDIWRYVKTLAPRSGPFRVGSSFWESVSSLFHDPVQRSNVDAALRVLLAHDEALVRLHPHVLEALAARLQFLGRFRAGTMVRVRSAENRVRELQGIRLESAVWLKQLLGAYAYLGQEHRLVERTISPRVVVANTKDRRHLQKLAADVALVGGDPEPLRRYVRHRAAELPLPGESRYQDLVQGKRIAVVGPAPTGEKWGDAIESYDLVVRPQFRRFSGEQAVERGSRTDIAYYSGRDLKEAWSDVSQAVARGEVHTVVGRPSYQPALGASPPSWFRLARTEFGLYFRGVPLAMPRILYDLIQFEPKEIGLFHADFYAGKQTFTPGYREGSEVFAPGAAINDLVIVHDLAYEFRCTKWFMKTGLITPYGASAEVLALNEGEYLSRLDNESALSVKWRP